MKPKKYEPGLTAKLKRLCPDLVAEAEALGFDVYVANWCRGWCYYDSSFIVVPSWLFKSKRSFNKRLTHYMAHELAHARCFFRHGDDQDAHGPKFFAEFKTVCPPELWHLELSYKPRNARAAGIKERK
jgi:hypothetical protein